MRPLPEYLRESLALLWWASSQGLPTDDYMPLLIAVHETFSNRNLAAVVAEFTGLDYYKVDNDHAAAQSSFPPLASDVARVRARLDAVGWIEDDT